MDQNDYDKELEDKLNDISLYGEFMSTFNYWVSSRNRKQSTASAVTEGQGPNIKNSITTKKTYCLQKVFYLTKPNELNIHLPSIFSHVKSWVS